MVKAADGSFLSESTERISDPLGPESRSTPDPCDPFELKLTSLLFFGLFCSNVYRVLFLYIGPFITRPQGSILFFQDDLQHKNISHPLGLGRTSGDPLVFCDITAKLHFLHGLANGYFAAKILGSRLFHNHRRFTLNDIMEQVVAMEGDYQTEEGINDVSTNDRTSTSRKSQSFNHCYKCGKRAIFGKTAQEKEMKRI